MAAEQKTTSPAKNERRPSASLYDMRNLMVSTPLGSAAGGFRTLRAVTPWSAEGPNPTTVVASVFVISCATFALAAMVLSSWEYGWRATDPLCTTDDCRQHAQRLSRALDRKAGPCGDPQRFSCGSWSYDAQVPLVKSVIQASEKSWFGRIADPTFLESRGTPATAAQFEPSAGVRKAVELVRQCIEREGETAEATEQLWRKFLDDNAFIWHRLNENVTGHSVSAIERLIVFAVRWRLPIWLDVHLTPGIETGARTIHLLTSPLVPLLYRMHNDLGFMSAGTQWVWKFLLSAAGRTMTDVDKEWLSRTMALHARATRLLFGLMQTQDVRKPAVIPLSKMATVGGSLSPHMWSSALQAAFQLDPPVTVDRDALHVSSVRLLETLELLFAEHGDRQMLVDVEWSIGQLFGPLILSKMVHVLRNDRYTSGFLERICGQHVESVFGYALAQYDKELRSAEERERLYEMLGAIKDTAVQKASRAVWIESPELRAAIASHVNATRTVVWGDSVDVSEATNKDSSEERQDQEWLIFWTFYANVPVDGTLYFERWHSALRYTLEWRSPLKHVLLQRLRGTCLDRLVQYDPASNAVVLCPSCLSAPFFYGRAQNSALYGGLGYLYARALASGVDYAPPFWSVTANATSTQIAESVTASVVVVRFRRNAAPFPEEDVPHGSSISTLKAASIDNTKVIPNGLSSISPARRAREEDGTSWSATPGSSTTESIPPLNQTSIVVASSTPVMPIRAQLFATEAGAEVFTSIPNQASVNRTQTDICKSSTLSLACLSLRRVKRVARHNMTSGRFPRSTKQPSHLEAAWPPRSGGAHGLPEDGGLSSGPKLSAVTPGGATSARVSSLSAASALQEEGPCSSEAADVSFLDVAALEIAYEAFAKLLSRGENVRLKDLPEFTTEQLFFLTACHTRCERVLRPEHRVCNDAALNVGAFARAFSCPAGTFMNPAVRCPFTWPRSLTLRE